jgi:chromosome segregation ATPase
MTTTAEGPNGQPSRGAASAPALEAGRRPPVELRLGDLRGVIDAVRKVVTDWDTFAGDVETLTREHAAGRAGFERLEQEQRELRSSLERLRAEKDATAQRLAELQKANERLQAQHEATTRTLTELRAAHEAMTAQRDAGTRELRELRERFETEQRNRQEATAGLETLLRRLKP